VRVEQGRLRKTIPGLSPHIVELGLRDRHIEVCRWRNNPVAELEDGRRDL
jgi:hypothetical protein